VPGEIFVISAPSGAGKTTLIKKLMAGDPALRFSISFTTRPPRPGEVHGVDYFFVSPEEFQRLQSQGGLVEWVEQFGFRYGTSRAWVLEYLATGADLVFDIEPRGARQIKSQFPEAVCIFVLPPSLEDLTQRLDRRGGDPSPAEMAARLEQGRSEIEAAAWYEFLVVNDDLDQALSQLKAIVLATRCRAPRLWPRLAPRFRA